MIMLTIELPTHDGPCTVATFRPDGSAPLPPVVLLFDGFGPRQAIFEMAARIASHGYVVAVPDLFHRAGSVLDITPPGVPREVKALFGIILGDPDMRARWRERFFVSATQPAHIESDVGATLDYLASRPDVRPGPAGLVGYCMGGNVALRAAAVFGPRIGALGVFHGGQLVTDAPDSPHLGAPRIKARVFVAGAIEDASFTDAIKARLGEALDAAHVPYAIETYAARHGFCVPDTPTFDAAAADRHYEAVAKLFREAL
jgi:carboxymethylenebutenolidase